MRNLRPRPTLEQIARWQDHARSTLNEAAVDQSDWHPAASFAVVFVQRQAENGEWERRIEVERTEVEPEQQGRTWPEWDCREICGWMREQLGLPGTAQPAPGQASGGERGRGELRIGSVTLIDPGSQLGWLGAATGGAPPVNVITSGAAPAPPAAPEGSFRVEIKVGGARRGQEIRVVARVLPRDAPGWNAQDPVVIKGAGAASFDLSRLPEGRHEVALIAWAPDGSMVPASVRLPELTIQPPQ